MKRGLLIGVGTLGGLGAVMAITPPQFGSSTGALGTLSGKTLGPATTTTTSTPAPASTPATVSGGGGEDDGGGGSATKIPATTKTTAAKSTAAQKAAAKKSAAAKKAAAAAGTATTTTSTPAPAAGTATTTTSTPAPAATKAATTSGVSGTFDGATSQTRFGPVQVQVTVSNGKITSAKALQYPNGDPRSSNISSQAIPYLVQETLASNSSNIQGVGGASYTSYGWYQSLQSALAKAGMK